MVFEIWKPACPLSGTSIQTIVMYSDAEKKRWSVQHRFAAVELFIQTESVTATQHGFWQQFLGCDAPSYNTLLLWISKWLHEGSVKDNNPNGHLTSARTPDNGPYVSENAEQCKVNMNAQYYTVMRETFLQNALHPP